MLIVMAGIAFGGYKVYGNIQYQRQLQFEKEREARVEEVTEATDLLKNEIEMISKLSVEEIQAFIEENAVVEEVVDKIAEDTNVDMDALEEAAEDIVYYDPWSDGDVSGNDLADMVEAFVDENLGAEASDVIDNILDGDDEEVTVDEGDDSSDSKKDKLDSDSKNQDTKDTDSEDSDEDNKDKNSEDKDENWESGSSKENVNRVAELGKDAVKDLDKEKTKEKVGELAKENHNLGDSVGGEDLTLEERQAIRTSEEETQLWIEADEKVIETSAIDFSDKKITCLGDSVTEAANLLEEPDYQQYTYPTKLQEILNCESMTNLGIGGSSFGRYWYEPFCDRYNQIPEDTDIIIIFGGYNDGYCLHEDMVGDIDRCEPNTLYGDINDLMVGLKKDYPDAEIIFMTPMPNLLHDVLRKERPELLPQTVVVNAILELAKKNEITVIDNYNANFLDSHDADIVSEYLPDSVHPNPEGYEVLAKHVAAELIRIEENKENEEPEPSPTPRNTMLRKLWARINHEEFVDEEAEETEDEDNEALEAEAVEGAANEVIASPSSSAKKTVISRDDSENDNSSENDEDADDPEAKKKATPSKKPQDEEQAGEDSENADSNVKESPKPTKTPGEKKVVIKRD